jgi:hypothetical protein
MLEVFLNSHPRNTKKRDKTKIRGKTDIEASRGGRKNKTGNRRSSAPARKTNYLLTFFFFFLVRFRAFLGKGSSNKRKQN